MSYIIDDGFQGQQFIMDLEKKILFQKKEADQKKEWIYGLTAIVTAYRSHFTEVRITEQGKNIDALLTTVHGEKFYFYNGKMMPAGLPDDDQDYRSYLNKYPLGEFQRDLQPRDFPPPVNYQFYYSLYGEKRADRAEGLEIFYINNRKFRFQKKQGASAAVKRIFTELEESALNDPVVKKWLDGINWISTYVDRTVMDTQRESLHSFGIALDILPRDRKKIIYWKWVASYKNDWWNVNEDEMYSVPLKVIETFEENGFTWGGKWFFYDRMHFEYRPDIINYARLLRDDPLVSLKGQL